MITLAELRRDGVCRDMDTDLFTGEDESLFVAGKRICHERCEIRVECLEFALATKQSWGVWGGTTHNDRKNILKVKHRVRCPGCRSMDVESQPGSEVCISCGLTWLA